jgi:copper(I)-binding protein
MQKSLFICAAFALSACSASTDNTDISQNAAAAKPMQSVEVSSARIHPPFQGRTTAASFFTLENKGLDTQLIAASSPISDSIEIHTHLREDGVMKMRRIDAVDLPAGSSVEFKPGGYHLMMFDTKLPLDMTEAPLTLTYSNGETVTLIVPIEGRADEDAQGSSHKGSGYKGE